ncbi:DegT/DnrJ/EryC1/StrS family aminotransferase [Spirosoma sp. RP8]|uniref:DegT/DnrJ/EryC1/StrS family aminotransferase n=1 Tax=Spirosoma liriopis TaxID=2937440 RepID=A0ABT0HRZ1_9BACT|nr:DegT/DnrJ/EryC1/StrS family aminotransferase [Spirosoma liriopis]MCK8494907.1 DegT/DnrJ/EryC1/StrS family aminotransferase [Spirosoma liriopis]
MIPRFNYSYSVGDFWNALQSLIDKQPTNYETISALFPQATLHFVSQARVGIFLALKAFDLVPGARVGVQPYTCSSVLSAIVAAGYKPLFIDIDEQLTIDTNDLQCKQVELDALIVTHTFGKPANIHQIRQIVGNLPVIEDCAHAFLSYYDGTPVGNFFDCAVFSFGDGKFPSFGSGALLVVNNPVYGRRIAEMVSELAEPGLLSELALIGKRILKAAVHSRMGGILQKWLVSETIVSKRNSAVSAFPDRFKKAHRSVASGLPTYISRIVERAATQRENARLLIDHNRSSFTVLNKSAQENAYVVVLLFKNRNDLYNYLREKGIGGAKHFQHAKIWTREFGYQSGQCPQFEQLVDNLLTIPCHYGLTQRDLEIINQSLHHFTRHPLPTHEESFS